MDNSTPNATKGTDALDDLQSVRTLDSSELESRRHEMPIGNVRRSLRSVADGSFGRTDTFSPTVAPVASASVRNADKPHERNTMSEVNVATLLLAQAQAKRAKRDARMSGATLLSHIVAFVNDGSAYEPNMQDRWNGSPTRSAVIARYNGIIKSNGLDNSVYCIDGGENGVCLVNLANAA